MLSTIKPESAYVTFKLNLTFELAPLHHGGRHQQVFARAARGKAEVQVEHISLTPLFSLANRIPVLACFTHRVFHMLKARLVFSKVTVLSSLWFQIDSSCTPLRRGRIRELRR